VTSSVDYLEITCRNNNQVPIQEIRTTPLASARTMEEIPGKKRRSSEAAISVISWL